MAQNTHVDVVIVQGNLIEIFGEIKMLGNYPDFHFDKKLSVITSDKTNQQQSTFWKSNCISGLARKSHPIFQ